MNATDAMIPTAALFPRICVNCDYSLEGLPLDAVCPECGTLEDPNTIVLKGWGQSSQREKGRVYWILTGIAIAMWTGILLFDLRFNRHGDAFIQVAIQGAPWAITLLAVRAIVFMRNIEGPPMRLVLSPQGYCRRIGPGPVKFKRWNPDLYIRLKPQRNNFYLLSAKWSGSFWTFRVSVGMLPFRFQAQASQAYALQATIQRWARESGTK